MKLFLPSIAFKGLGQVPMSLTIIEINPRLTSITTFVTSRVVNGQGMVAVPFSDGIISWLLKD
jgi:hypothetical protein